MPKLSSGDNKDTKYAKILISKFIICVILIYYLCYMLF